MRCENNSPCSSPKDPAPSAMPAQGCGRTNDQGVALVITLLLLFLLSVIGLAAVLTSSSDLLINGYYRNYRGSFYAADSGLNIARQEIYNYFDNNGPTSWTSYPPVVATTWGNNAATYITNTYGTNSYSLNSHGQAGSSWAGSFKITSVTVAPSPTSPQPQGSPLGTSPPLNTEYSAYKYVYNYTLTSVGTAQGSETARIYEQGTISVTVSQGAGTTANTVSFSAFGAFIDSFSSCSAPLVPGYLTGPMYAKGEWNWGSSSTGYTFTDPVSQTDSQFSYWPSGGCVQSSQPKYGSIVPAFHAGYSLSVSPITLPTNTFSQEWAVLDGMGCGENNGNVCGNPTSNAPLQPTPAQLSTTLKDITGTAYPSGGATSGVFLPYTCSGGTCSLNNNAGGIYVKGDASVVLSASGSSQQLFTVAQPASASTGAPVVSPTGSLSCTYRSWNNTTKCTQNYQQVTTTTTPTAFTTVTVDPVAATTAVSAYTSNANATVTSTASSSCSVSGNGSCSPSQPSSFSGGNEVDTTSNTATTTLSLIGVPHDFVTTPSQAATMLYVDGDITSLSGPNSGAAIQDNSMVTVVGNGDVTVTGNITYKTKPVTTSANQNVSGSSPACCNGDPVDTLIPLYQNMNQVLGIFTATGNFILSPTHSGADIEVDASIAMISSAGESNSNIGHMATGNSVGTFTNIGGRIENRAHSVSMNTSNVYFDRRFTTRSNFAPPWFPSTIVAQNLITNTLTVNSQPNPPSRTLWQYQTAGE